MNRLKGRARAWYTWRSAWVFREFEGKYFAVGHDARSGRVFYVPFQTARSVTLRAMPWCPYD